MPAHKDDQVRDVASADETNGVTETEDVSTWQSVKRQDNHIAGTNNSTRDARECALQPIIAVDERSSGIGAL